MMKIDVIRVQEIPNKPKLDKIRSDYRASKQRAHLRLWGFIILMAVLAVVIWRIGNHAEQATVTQAGDQVVNQVELNQAQATVTQAGDQVELNQAQATVTQAGDQVVNQAEPTPAGNPTEVPMFKPTAPITTLHQTWLPIILIDEKEEENQ